MARSSVAPNDRRVGSSRLWPRHPDRRFVEPDRQWPDPAAFRVTTFGRGHGGRRRVIQQLRTARGSRAARAEAAQAKQGGSDDNGSIFPPSSGSSSWPSSSYPAYPGLGGRKYRGRRRRRNGPIVSGVPAWAAGAATSSGWADGAAAAAGWAAVAVFQWRRLVRRRRRLGMVMQRLASRTPTRHRAVAKAEQSDGEIVTIVALRSDAITTLRFIMRCWRCSSCRQAGAAEGMDRPRGDPAARLERRVRPQEP